MKPLIPQLLSEPEPQFPSCCGAVVLAQAATTTEAIARTRYWA